MKVYEMELKLHEPFVFYLREGKVILTTDPQYPVPTGAALWDKSTRTWIPSKDRTDRFLYPTFLILKEDYEEWIEEQMQPLIEFGCEQDLIPSDKNIIIAKKDRGNTIEVGMSIHLGYTDTINEKLQRHVDQILKLKAFW